LPDITSRAGRGGLTHDGSSGMTRPHERASSAAVSASSRGPKRLGLVAVGVALVVQMVILYSPEVAGAPPITGLDKLVHVLVFAAPALAALLVGISAPWALGVLAVHAPVSELIQHFALSHRSGDVLDVMADFVGIALGWSAFMVWSRRQS
jgi:hypothetical protein